VHSLPKLVSVVGGKHSGKTTVVEHLIAEFKRRGCHVGAIKEMVRIPSLDTPAKETDRYAKAGAETIVALPKEETVIFIKRRLDIKEVLPYLKGLDYVILEGFESESAIPKIIVAKTVEEAECYIDGATIAISGIIVDSQLEAKTLALGYPLFDAVTEADKLADLVEIKTLEFSA
jgi:molybdopterin-guanine dinucleotide biosynthesis protein MobB